MYKEKLHKIVDALPEQQVESALVMLEGLLRNKKVVSNTPAEGTEKNLDDFLSVLVSGISNVLYDLAKEAERRNETIVANRHNFSMKKIKEAWEDYKS